MTSSGLEDSGIDLGMDERFEPGLVVGAGVETSLACPGSDLGIDVEAGLACPWSCLGADVDLACPGSDKYTEVDLACPGPSLVPESAIFPDIYSLRMLVPVSDTLFEIVSGSFIPNSDLADLSPPLSGFSLPLSKLLLSETQIIFSSVHICLTHLISTCEKTNSGGQS